VVGEVGLDDVEQSVPVVVAESQAHTRLLHAIVVVCKAGVDATLGKCSVAIVVVKQATRGVRCDVDILPAVCVQVGGKHTERVGLPRLPDAGGAADVGECPVAVVVVKKVGGKRKSERAADHRQAQPGACRIGPGQWGPLEIKVEVVGDQQVEQAVTVVVEKGGTAAPAHPFGGHASSARDISERFVPIVTVQDVLSPV